MHKTTSPKAVSFLKNIPLGSTEPHQQTRFNDGSRLITSIPSGGTLASSHSNNHYHQYNNNNNSANNNNNNANNIAPAATLFTASPLSGSAINNNNSSNRTTPNNITNNVANLNSSCSSSSSTARPNSSSSSSNNASNSAATNILATTATSSGGAQGGPAGAGSRSSNNGSSSHSSSANGGNNGTRSHKNTSSTAHHNNANFTATSNSRPKQPNAGVSGSGSSSSSINNGDFNNCVSVDDSSTAPVLEAGNNNTSGANGSSTTANDEDDDPDISSPPITRSEGIWGDGGIHVNRPARTQAQALATQQQESQQRQPSKRRSKRSTHSSRSSSAPDHDNADNNNNDNKKKKDHHSHKMSKAKNFLSGIQLDTKEKPSASEVQQPQSVTSAVKTLFSPGSLPNTASNQFGSIAPSPKSASDPSGATSPADNSSTAPSAVSAPNGGSSNNETSKKAASTKNAKMFLSNIKLDSGAANNSATALAKAETAQPALTTSTDGPKASTTTSLPPQRNSGEEFAFERNPAHASIDKKFRRVTNLVIEIEQKPAVVVPQISRTPANNKIRSTGGKDGGPAPPEKRINDKYHPKLQTASNVKEMLRHRDNQPIHVPIQQAPIAGSDGDTASKTSSGDDEDSESIKKRMYFTSKRSGLPSLLSSFILHKKRRHAHPIDNVIAVNENIIHNVVEFPSRITHHKEKKKTFYAHLFNNTEKAHRQQQASLLDQQQQQQDAPGSAGSGSNLSPSNSRGSPKSASSSSSSTNSVDEDMEYNPYFLDDPDIRCGKRKKVMNLCSLLISTIPYVNNKELKADLNAQFRERHAYLPESLTLSKIRNLKKAMLELAFGYTKILDVSTVAMAHVYLEKLILKGTVTKQNRKVIGAACVLLAVKFNQPNIDFEDFFDALEDCLGVSKKKVLDLEFQVFAELEFTLLVKEQDFYPHYTRLLQQNNLTPLEYLGEVLYNRFFLNAGNSNGGNTNNDDSTNPEEKNGGDDADNDNNEEQQQQQHAGVSHEYH